MRALLAASVVAAMLGVGSPACAERHWQCGNGIKVPATGSRQDRDAACQKAREDAGLASHPLTPAQKRSLEDRVEKLEQQYGVERDDQKR